jgi:murein DD-endopeptidase MepM/ murein hydrolase activator NlpD
MFAFARGLILGVVLFTLGWVIGSVFPAPPAITRPIAQNAPGVAARLGLDNVTFESLSGVLSAEQVTRLRQDASRIAARAGEAIVVERDADAMAAQIEALPASAAAANASARGGALAFETSLSLCPGMAVSNAPAADASRHVRNYASLISVQGVRLASNPTLGACLSSGLGPRGQGTHRGVDYHSADGGPVMAAGAGAVIEAKYRDDYGNMVLIDHGGGVYTRYAHLSHFADGIVVGARVEAGQQIGLMGNTAGYAIPVHLHYEILTGDYGNPRASFGLAPQSPFTYMASN